MPFVPCRYGHLTETEGEKVLSPALGLLKLALGATRAIKRLLGIDLNLLSQRAAAMAHAAEQVSIPVLSLCIFMTWLCSCFS